MQTDVAMQTESKEQMLQHNLSGQSSNAYIQNPHASNNKAFMPNEEETRLGEGTWKTSLREPLANAHEFIAVTVRNHRHDGSDSSKGTEVVVVDVGEGVTFVDNN